MVIKRQLTASILMAFTLAGCALSPEQCDSTNRDASIIEKARCDSAYQTNLHNTQIKVDNATELNEQFKAVYTALEKEKGEVSTELRNNKSEYAALDSALNKLLSSLKEKAAGKTALESEITGLQDELASINTSGSSSVIEKKAQLDQLTQRVSDLQQVLGLQ